MTFYKKRRKKTHQQQQKNQPPPQKKPKQTKKQTQINKTQTHVTMNMMSLLCFSKKKNEQYE